MTRPRIVVRAEANMGAPFPSGRAVLQAASEGSTIAARGREDQSAIRAERWCREGRGRVLPRYFADGLGARTLRAVPSPTPESRSHAVSGPLGTGAGQDD